MNDNPKLDRRKFLGAGLAGAGLLAAGGLLGWITTRAKRAGAAARAAKPPLGSRFTYDVSGFEHTDPALLLYAETGRIPTGFTEPKCLATGPGDTLCVGGDRALNLFNRDGKLESTINLPGQPHAVGLAADDRRLVALHDHIEIYNSAGTLLVKGAPLGEKVYLTGIAHSGESIFVADAGNREIIRCDRDGKAVARFGRIRSKEGNPGFVVPSPYFDLSFGADGLLWVANPGRHRLEAYTPEGTFELGWGKTAMSVEGFCGCCNPVYFTRLPDGRFVTSEKGLNRIKIYDVQGNFQGVVAGPEHLVKDRELARKACTDCHIGFGFAVACDSQNRVFALDPVARDVRIFTPKGGPRPVSAST